MTPAYRSRLASRENIATQLPQRFPLLRSPPAIPTLGALDPRGVALGLSAEGQPVWIGDRPRFEHAHVLGTTGGGKTNFLEHLIRQDIKKGDGLLVIDAHGNHPDSLYRSLITWLDRSGYAARRPVHLIDPNADSHVAGFNPLAMPDPTTSVSVVAGTTLEAIERVWGDEDTHSKPTIRRILKGTFAALAELRLTLAEAELLFDHRDEHGVRRLVLDKLDDRYAKQVFQDLHRLAANDRTGQRYRDEIIGPVNRLAEFASTPSIRQIIGQRERVLDLRQALDEGHIILVNLSGGNAVNDADSELLGRLLTRFVFFHAKRRRTKRPFWFYLDECQRYLSGDVPSLLAEARKFCIGVTLSHQWQSQLGSRDQELLAAVHNATNLKVSFRIKHPKEAKEVAEAIVPIDLETPVRALIKPTVVGHVRTWFNNWSSTEGETESTSESFSESESFSDTEGSSRSSSISKGTGKSSGQSGGSSWTVPAQTILPPQPDFVTLNVGQSAGVASHEACETSTSESSSISHSVSNGRSVTEAHARSYSESRGQSEGLEPVYRDLPSAVHSYENALYMAAQLLRSLGTGEAYASLVDEYGLRITRMRVPRVQQVSVTDREFVRIRTAMLEASPSATTADEVHTILEQRERNLLEEAARAGNETEDPPTFRVPIPKRGESGKAEV